MQSDAEAVWIRELYEGILGRKLSRQGMGKFRAKLFFFFPLISHTDSKLLCYQNAKEYFFLFLCIKKILSLALFTFPIQTPGPVLQRSLQLKRKENYPICKENTPFWPQHDALHLQNGSLVKYILPCSLLLFFPVPPRVCFQPGRTHTHFSFDWCQTEHLQLLLELKNKAA